MPQTTLSVVLEVAPESARPLLKIIEQVSGAEETWRPGDTELYSRLKWGVPSLHFMSMSVFHGADYDPIFVIEANFDGPPGPFWAQLEATLGPNLRLMLRCCKRPADSSGPLYDAVTKTGTSYPVAPYLERKTLTPSVFHHGNRGLERARILNDADLFLATRTELAQADPTIPNPYRGITAQAIHKKLRAALLSKFPWLDTPAPARISPAERLVDLLKFSAFVFVALFCLSIPGLALAADHDTVEVHHPVRMCGVAGRRFSVADKSAAGRRGRSNTVRRAHRQKPFQRKQAAFPGESMGLGVLGGGVPGRLCCRCVRGDFRRVGATLIRRRADHRHGHQRPVGFDHLLGCARPVQSGLHDPGARALAPRARTARLLAGRAAGRSARTAQDDASRGLDSAEPHGQRRAGQARRAAYGAVPRWPSRLGPAPAGSGDRRIPRQHAHDSLRPLGVREQWQPADVLLATSTTAGTAISTTSSRRRMVD